MTIITAIVAIALAFSVGAVSSWQLSENLRVRPLKKKLKDSSKGLKLALDLVALTIGIQKPERASTKARGRKTEETDLILSPFQVNFPGQPRPPREED